MSNLTYHRPILYPKQERAIFSDKRWALCEASAQPLDTPIPTPLGWRRFGDLTVGDTVFSMDGSITEVTEIIPHGRREVYRLEFTGGAVTRACGDHLWEVDHESGRGRRVLSTKKFASFSERTRLCWKFPICEPVDYWIDRRPLHPWLVGVLIGDGNICNNVISISSADSDLIERVQEVVPKGYLVEKQSGEYSYVIKPKVRGAGYERPSIRFKADGYEVSIAGIYIGRTKTEAEALALHKQAMQAKFGDDLPELNIRQALRELGLLGLKHNEKFIPDCYKYNDVDTRLEILRGLLDTDGSMNNNTAVIEQTSERLASDIEEVAKSLGCFAKTTYTAPRKEGWKGSYRTLIRHEDVKSLFWLQRKKDMHVPGLKPERRLISITPDGFAEVQCIAVSHPSELYLTEDFIVTHNTKSGKTVASIARMIEWGLLGNGLVSASPGQSYWWVAPVSDQARIAFNRVKLGLTPGTFTARESPIPQIQLITGPNLVFKSSDNADSLYGEDVFGAIIDEASRCRPDAWYAVRSTLTATRGPCVIIGNVKGRKNWFYEFCRRAEAGQEPNASFSRITWRDAVEAGVLDMEEIEDAKRNLPELVFRELYEATASDDTGNPFGLDHILACVFRNSDGTLSSSIKSNQPPVAFGIDLAKKQDYLVVIGLDADGRVCVFQRWQGVPWRDSIRRIHEIIGEDTPALVDSTGVGDPVLEELQVGHGNFRGFTFSSRSKQRLMEGLAVSIQGHEVSFPDGPIRAELEYFEYLMTRTGVSYSAPEGFNDDCVCALALAREQWSTTAPGANLMQYYASEARAAREAIEVPESNLQFTREILSRAELLDNELTELYNQTLNDFLPQLSRCAACGEKLDSARITDGEFNWHPSCPQKRIFA